ncbi:2-dehydro-3-deoxyglucarate aldolase [Cupriavidus pampae]|uniref:5-keto-4-deoxy-D-glucarate aldolase n=1 Tax=Cupriavidus pampae TaxID=659251 RepID=A0ABM8XJS5_9BURK|nr:2-dehydro-3-deoxyglucarate aldolase [Cupriavidus pampae]CAG9180445.1 5-keto-4-deoxy-D-glucarate aldolase [Cupriavidus pampae]
MSTTQPNEPAHLPHLSPLPNKFRADILARKRLIGCWSSLGHPITTEIVGLAGFDWILLDGEHSPNDVLTFVPQLMALKDSVSAPVVRPPWNDPVMLKRLLDIGFYNFLVPFVESAEEARRAVRATRYPPDGIRGVSGIQRQNRYGTLPDFFKTINENICVLVQVESRKGVEAIDEICAEPGVDGIFIGPNDLAAAYGHLGNTNHPEVQEAVQRIYDAANRAGKAIGTLTPVEADARRYLDMGAHFVAVGLDHGLLRDATRALRQKFAD